MSHLESGLISAPFCEYFVPTSPQWILTRLSNSTPNGTSSTACTGHIRLRLPLIRHQLPARLPSSTRTPCLPTTPRFPPASGLPVLPDASRATRNRPCSVATLRRTRSANASFSFFFRHTQPFTDAQPPPRYVIHPVSRPIPAPITRIQPRNASIQLRPPVSPTIRQLVRPTWSLSCTQLHISAILCRSSRVQQVASRSASETHKTPSPRRRSQEYLSLSPQPSPCPPRRYRRCLWRRTQHHQQDPKGQRQMAQPH